MKAWRVIDIINKAVGAKGINMINSSLPVAESVIQKRLSLLLDGK
jgi:hypothetical protein